MEGFKGGRWFGSGGEDIYRHVYVYIIGLVGTYVCFVYSIFNYLAVAAVVNQ